MRDVIEMAFIWDAFEFIWVSLSKESTTQAFWIIRDCLRTFLQNLKCVALGKFCSTFQVTWHDFFSIAQSHVFPMSQGWESNLASGHYISKQFHLASKSLFACISQNPCNNLHWLKMYMQSMQQYFCPPLRQISQPTQFQINTYWHLFISKQCILPQPRPLTLPEF